MKRTQPCGRAVAVEVEDLCHRVSFIVCFASAFARGATYVHVAIKRRVTI